MDALRSALTPLLGRIGAILGPLTLYLGLIMLAQLSDDRWFIGAIDAGFGTQICLSSLCMA